jgi:hypothetical protein
VEVHGRWVLAIGCECWRGRARNAILGCVDWGTFSGLPLLMVATKACSFGVWNASALGVWWVVGGYTDD